MRVASRMTPFILDARKLMGVVRFNTYDAESGIDQV